MENGSQPHGIELDHPRPKVRRGRTGCQTCRTRKIKCDEKRPICMQCRKGSRTCAWSTFEYRRTSVQRRPKSTACDSCRDKKLRCVGDIHDPCEKCKALGLECVRTRGDAVPDASSASHHSIVPQEPTAQRLNPQLSSHESRRGPLLSHTQTLSRNLPIVPLPVGKELEYLIQLYFSSVHHFGFLAFIHPLQFSRLLANGKAPQELILIMIANAMRFAGPVTSENLAAADAWADAAVGALLPRIYQGYGVIQLMALLLAQHYETHRSKFTSAYLLGANCSRMMQMMSLHTFDRTYPENLPLGQKLSPLLSREALRRVAWSTFYLDSMTDAGRYGSQTTDEYAYRVQLPCDEESFLGDDRIITEPLFPGQMPFSIPNDNLPHASLDMSAYLIRTAAARRRALYFAYRASYQEQAVEKLSADLFALKAETQDLFAALPHRFQFNEQNILIHHKRLTTFTLLHILRHNIFIILERAALQIYPRDPSKAALVSEARHSRITRGLAIADIVSEGLSHGIFFDPHVGVQAYVALEILLFEPRRLASEDTSIDPKAPELLKAATHLLTAIRSIGSRSNFVRHLHLEAVYRIIRCGCPHILSPEDRTLIQRNDGFVSQVDAEYDFRDLRGAKLERLAKRGKLPNETVTTAPDGVLLDDSTSPESTSSGRMDIILDTLPSTDTMTYPLLSTESSGGSTDQTQEGQLWREQMIGPENADHLLSPVNWLWPFEDLEDHLFNEFSGFSGRL